MHTLKHEEIKCKKKTKDFIKGKRESMKADLLYKRSNKCICKSSLF